MSDYTPDENDVALIYVAAWLEQSDPSPGRIYNEVEATAQEAFDHFIAKVKRDAAREALAGLADNLRAARDRPGTPFVRPLGFSLGYVENYRETHHPEDVTP